MTRDPLITTTSRSTNFTDPTLITEVVSTDGNESRTSTSSIIRREKRLQEIERLKQRFSRSIENIKSDNYEPPQITCRRRPKPTCTPTREIIITEKPTVKPVEQKHIHPCQCDIRPTILKYALILEKKRKLEQMILKRRLEKLKPFLMKEDEGASFTKSISRKAAGYSQNKILEHKEKVTDNAIDITSKSNKRNSKQLKKMSPTIKQQSTNFATNSEIPVNYNRAALLRAAAPSTYCGRSPVSYETPAFYSCEYIPVRYNWASQLKMESGLSKYEAIEQQLKEEQKSAEEGNKRPQFDFGLKYVKHRFL